MAVKSEYIPQDDLRWRWKVVSTPTYFPAHNVSIRGKESSAVHEEEIIYINTKGDGTKWEKGTEVIFAFQRSDDTSSTFSHFTGVEVDGKALTTDDYTAVQGSVVISLKESFLETLSAGTHTLTALFDDAEAETAVFEVAQTQTTDSNNGAIGGGNSGNGNSVNNTGSTGGIGNTGNSSNTTGTSSGNTSNNSFSGSNSGSTSGSSSSSGTQSSSSSGNTSKTSPAPVAVASTPAATQTNFTTVASTPAAGNESVVNYSSRANTMTDDGQRTIMVTIIMCTSVMVLLTQVKRIRLHALYQLAAESLSRYTKNH